MSQILKVLNLCLGKVIQILILVTKCIVMFIKTFVRKFDEILIPFLLLLVWFFFQQSAAIRLFTACGIVLCFIFCLKRRKSAFEVMLIFFVIAMMVLGLKEIRNLNKPIQDSIHEWNSLIEDVIRHSFQLPTPWGPIIKEPSILTVPKQGPLKNQPHIDVLYADAKQAKIGIIPEVKNKNLINNGNFQIPFGSDLSNWGSGFYSDQFGRFDPKRKFIWINFLDANIDVSIEETEKGNTLKIAHYSETRNHSVGVMEQYIDAKSGIYRLTFWAKAADDFESGGLQFFATDDWRITDKEDPNIKRGFYFEKAGPFEWQQFSGEIQIDRPGRRTFSIVSANKGTVRITDLSLIKIRDLKK